MSEGLLGKMRDNDHACIRKRSDLFVLGPDGIRTPSALIVQVLKTLGLMNHRCFGLSCLSPVMHPAGLYLLDWGENMRENCVDYTRTTSCEP